MESRTPRRLAVNHVTMLATGLLTTPRHSRCIFLRLFRLTTKEGRWTMSGHSKWAQIRRAKGVNDARRGQLFTRLGREIVVAVREGGCVDPNSNFLRCLDVLLAR